MDTDFSSIPVDVATLPTSVIDYVIENVSGQTICSAELLSDGQTRGYTITLTNRNSKEYDVIVIAKRAMKRTWRMLTANRINS